MDTYPVPPKKKGCGPLAWLGMGCGAVIVIVVLIAVGGFVFFGPQIRQFAEDYQKNPARTAATTMVKVSMGQFELVAEDDVNKRYTVKEKSNGDLTTFYWDARTQAAVQVHGDFSAIPADANQPQGQPPEGKITPK